MSDTEGRRVGIITGAAGGLGLAIASRLAAAGVWTFLADIDSSSLQRAQTSLNDVGHDCEAVVTDVSDEKDVAAMADFVRRTSGRIDILVNCAGIVGSANPLPAQGIAEWDRLMAVNVKGTFLTCRAVVPVMLQQGYGRIVNVASVSGKEGNPNMAPYSASKAAVIGLTKALAKEVARSGVLVNAVTPAVIDTALLRNLTSDAVRYMVDKIPMGRVGRPDEVAALVGWMCSDECSFSTGAVFDISGGRATY